jgi:hypothetical protein
MSGARDVPASGMAHVQVAEDCTLDGGSWRLALARRGMPSYRIGGTV